MNIPTIEMPRAAAREAFIEYRAAVRASLDKEAETYDERRREALATRREADEALTAGYLQLSLGHAVIDLHRVISEGGQDAQFRPRLAIARADETSIWMTRNRDGSIRFSGGPTRSDQRDPRTDRQWNLPAGTLPAMEAIGRNTWVSGNAVVPTIPPRFRPGTPERYHLLWEAEWNKVPPRDPALLRALGNGLYVVLAVWDLTELERAVLGAGLR
jgi:hypothetical protein